MSIRRELKKQKAEITKGPFLRQLGHLYSRSAVFRPLLAEGLALSGVFYIRLNIVNCQLERTAGRHDNKASYRLAGEIQHQKQFIK